MELVLIEPKSNAWEEMWLWLESHPINEGLENPSVAMNEGQAWQYTGSYKQGNTVISTFRHRLHPITNGVYNISYQHIGVMDNEITKKYRI